MLFNDRKLKRPVTESNMIEIIHRINVNCCNNPITKNMVGHSISVMLHAIPHVTTSNFEEGDF